MKIKVNVRDYLADQCGHEIRMDVPMDVPVRLDIDDLLDENGIDEEHEFDLDIHELLAENRQIAHIWGIDDVQTIRPDLDDDQAWQVLQAVERCLNSEYGVSWQTIKDTAEELYGPRRERHWHGRIDVMIDDTAGYGQDEALARFRDMAQRLAKEAPGLTASADEGSIRLVESAETDQA